MQYSNAVTCVTSDSQLPSVARVSVITKRAAALLAQSYGGIDLSRS